MPRPRATCGCCGADSRRSTPPRASRSCRRTWSARSSISACRRRSTCRCQASTSRPTAPMLANLASFHRSVAPAVVSHYDATPVVDIFGAVEGADLGFVAAQIQRVLAESKSSLPRGSQVAVHGQVKTMTDSFAGLLLGLAAAIVLVYLLIVVNFQSWLDPFIIITALPAALAGIVWMLFLSDTPVSVPALTGAIMCMGVATANSVLVVSFARERMNAGDDAAHAAVQAGVTRSRPVLMPALAMLR